MFNLAWVKHPLQYYLEFPCSFVGEWLTQDTECRCTLPNPKIWLISYETDLYQWSSCKMVKTRKHSSGMRTAHSSNIMEGGGAVQRVGAVHNRKWHHSTHPPPRPQTSFAGGKSGYVWEGGYVLGVGTQAPPRKWDLGYNRIRSASGRYASYWNAFFLLLFFQNDEITNFSVEIAARCSAKFCSQTKVTKLWPR